MPEKRREEQAVLPGNLRKAAVTTLGAAARAQLAQEYRGLIRPDDDLAAVSVRDRARIDGCAVGNRRVLRVSNLRVLALIVAADKHRTAARIAARADRRAAKDGDVLAEDLDRAASRSGVVALRLEQAGRACGSFVAAVEGDCAVAITDRVGADDAVGVDDGIEKRI